MPKPSVKCEPPSDDLCPTCKQLGLSAEKFLPGQPSDSILPGLLAKPFDLVGLQPRDLEYLDEIYLRRDRCSLCWLLFNATHVDKEPSDGSVARNRPGTTQLIGYDGLTSEGKRTGSAKDRPRRKILVKSLGFRFIWVDALCILQDDTTDAERIIPMMDVIYGNSALNICAAAGNSSSQGIPGSPGSQRAAWQPRAVCAGLELVATKTIEGLIENSVWNSRAWTFQERMLARRSMIFVDNRVFFQCRQATWSEEVCSEAPTSSWTLEMIRSPLKSFEKNPVRLYLECVELFSGRLLTYQADRLPAFEGMSAVLCPPLRAFLFYGLPDSYFDFALLWEKKVSGPRVKECSDRHLYPSWSWSGWHGTSVWRLPMISGTLLNLHEWLECHTWVVWYKLDPAKTTFLPVWSSSEIHPSPNRWHGYSKTTADSDPFGRRRVSDDDDTLPTLPASGVRKSECLYFWTWTAFFQISRQSRTGPSFASKLEPGLLRFGLLDANGDWCGTVILEDVWSARVGAVVEFAAVSDARDFSMEELDTWNYYVPEDREVAEWHLYYALLIVWDDDRAVARRDGLAKIYRRAFDLASFEPGRAWREVTLG
ncbi:hypothetical protein LZ31DRAFT_538734 [Colletotrichum somersetense]|nr:hypothetical protein LZ31DRAFT_538734 [Colletotrichum somersetense]